MSGRHRAEAVAARVRGDSAMPAFHPRATPRVPPAEGEPRTVLMPLRTLRRVGDTHPLPRVESTTTPTLALKRTHSVRPRNGREGTAKLRMKARARSRAALLLGSDFLNPILVGLLGLAVLAAAGILWTGSVLDLSGPASPSGSASPSVSRSAVPSSAVTTNARDDATQQAAIDPSSSAADEPTTPIQQNVAPAVVAAPATPSAPPPPTPQTAYTSPQPGTDVTPPDDPSTPPPASTSGDVDSSPSPSAGADNATDSGTPGADLLSVG